MAGRGGSRAILNVKMDNRYYRIRIQPHILDSEKKRAGIMTFEWPDLSEKRAVDWEQSAGGTLKLIARNDIIITYYY